MADQHLPDGAHQAGGGVSGRVQQVRTLSPHILAHLQKIYAAYGKSWNPAQTAAFLKAVQQDSPSELALELVDDKDWDIQTFLKYMTSSVANVVAPSQEQDLGWPLSAYFISSSHNTYLTGNQLSSDSSADAYKNVLLRGCRCIEVDVWDGNEPDSDSDTSISSSDEDEEKAAKKAQRLSQVKDKLPSSLVSRLEKTSLGEPPLAKTDSAGSQASLQQTPSIKEPRVYHGYTLTKDISFREVCHAIRDYGFVTTDNPLIVSLEVHCSPEQQNTMVAIMKEVWSDFLLPEPKEGAQALPPPSELRGKILVKVKYAPQEDSSNGNGNDTSPTPPPPGEAAPPQEKKPSKIIQALSKLGIYTKGVSFKSLTQPEATMPTHIFSLSESGVVEVHQKSARGLFEHNRCYLMRAYPSGLRIRSSNLDPAPFWRKGIQVVALNWQNWDEGMMLNEGMFAGTGGYVLKPEGYRPARSLPPPITSAAAGTPPPPTTQDPTPQAVAVRHYTMDLIITVLAAQSLSLPLGDTKPNSFRPYLKVEIHVEEPGERHGTSDPLPDDGKEKEGEYKAKTKSLKGMDPDWSGYPLKFEKIPGVVPELSFVRFLVRDDEIGKDSLAAWACVRLDRLREGYRFIHLLDARGVETEGVVLVKIEKRLY